MPVAGHTGARQIAGHALERRHGVGRRAARAELIEREQADMRVAIAGRDQRRGAGLGVVARPQAAQRLEARDRRVVDASRGQQAVKIRGRHLRRRGRRRAHRQPANLRVRVVRRRAQGFHIEGGGSRQRLEGEPADARAGHRFTFHRDREAAQQRQRLVGRRSQLALDPNEAFETLRNAQAVGHRLRASRHLDQHALRAFHLRRVDVRKAAERIADRFAHVRFGFDFQARDKRARHRLDSRGGRGAEPCTLTPGPRTLFPSLRGLRHRIRRLSPDLGQRVAQQGHEIGNQRGTLEAADRANRDADGLRVATVQTGAQDREIARRLRAAIFRLQHGEPCRAWGSRLILRVSRRTEKTAENAKNAEKSFLCDLSALRGFF
jgi:hypothetical protein